LENWNDEKWLLEESAARALVATLNAHLGTAYEVVAHGDRPDIVIEDRQSGEKIGVEVTHLFYDQEEARMMLGRSQQLAHSPEYIDEYIRRLNALLRQKAVKAKGYCHDFPLALLIRVASPVFHTHDFRAYVGKIVVPPSDFLYIWLLFYDFRQQRWAVLEQLR